jgi:large repetitive protein
MNHSVRRDLERWERGELSLADLQARHPEAKKTAELHTRLLSLRTEPTPEPTLAPSIWDAVTVDRRAPSRRIGRRINRATLAAAAFVLITASLAVAIEPVRRGAATLIGEAAQVLTAVGEGADRLAGQRDPPSAGDLLLAGREDQGLSWRPVVTGERGARCTISEMPAQGTATLDPDCSAGTYLPDPGFSGSDGFSYRIRDRFGLSAPAAVRISVAAINDAPVALMDVATTNEDRTVAVPILANDVDPDGDSRPPNRQELHDSLTRLRVTWAAAQGGGTVESPGRRLLYTPPPDFHGTTMLRYAVSDGNDGQDRSTVVVQVRPVNDPPVAPPLTLDAVEDQGMDWVPSPVDVEGDVLTCGIMESPVHGTVSLDRDCSSGTYEPDQDFTGTATIRYSVADGSRVTTGEAVVRVAGRNDPPVIKSVTGETDEDAEAAWSPSVEDVDDDELSCSIESPPAHGRAWVAADCSTGTYRPDPYFNGPDTFRYSVTDGDHEETVSSSVTFAVHAVNDPPTAAPDTVTTFMGQQVTVPVLANDRDVDGESLVLGSLTAARSGTAVANPDGTVTYHPAPGFVGEDEFAYVLMDPHGATGTSVVRVLVVPAPAPG